MYLASILTSIALAFFSTKKTRFFFALLISLIAVFIVGFRSTNSGFDTVIYLSIFENTKLLIENSENFLDIYLNFINVQPEPLFSFLVYILACLNLSSEAYLFVIAFISFSIMLSALSKYSVNDSAYILALMLCSFTFVFIFSNAIRQGIALSIVFYAFFHLLRGDGVKYILYIVIASMFHSSAMLLLCLFFMMKLDYKTIFYFFIFSFFLFVVFGFDSVVTYMRIPVISDKIIYYSNGDSAAGWSFISAVLIPLILFILVFFFRNNFNFLNVSKLYICLSMLCLMLSFSSTMFDRVSAYRFLFEPILFLSFSSLFRQKVALKLSIVALGLIYFLCIVFPSSSIRETLYYN